ncbi:MAG: methyltransferase domain-containing protein [Deltaproteobacteria bacterium]|nr:methyltransferase domain-containing protein [Deltaproteobacteria bacterium]MDZ4347110.1 methyltransferase domain-containing protein [Candidatus Binatia bacterium]
MKLSLLLILLTALPSAVHAQDAVKRDDHQMHRLHNDPKAYLDALEDPKRDAYQKPHGVIHALNLKSGEVIADIGAGSGYFTFHLARHVGDKGKVYAVDVSPEMILHVNRRIRDQKANNVVAVLSDPDDPLLPDRSVNRFFFSDSWHHIENQSKYLSLMKRMLKPGGEIVMIDFHKKELPVGPPMQMKIAREDLIKQLDSNGYRLAKEHSFLPYQYFLVFVPR